MALIEVVHDNSTKQVPGTRRGEPLVRAVSQEQIEHESELGLAFSWVSLNADINIGDTVLIVRNTSDLFLIMTEITVFPANVTCDYSINRGNATTAFTGGSAIVATNLNGKFLNQTFDYDAHTDEESVADGTQVDGIWCSIVESKTKSLAGNILIKNDFIQVNQETESTSGRIILKGFFIEELQ